MKHPEIAPQNKLEITQDNITYVLLENFDLSKDLTDICKELGWQPKNKKTPSEKHYVVAIVHVLLKTTRELNLNITQLGSHSVFRFTPNNDEYPTRYFTENSMKLLRQAALKLNYPEIECDAAFIAKLQKQLLSCLT